MTRSSRLSAGPLTVRSVEEPRQRQVGERFPLVEVRLSASAWPRVVYGVEPGGNAPHLPGDREAHPPAHDDDRQDDDDREPETVPRSAVVSTRGPVVDAASDPDEDENSSGPLSRRGVDLNMFLAFR